MPIGKQPNRLLSKSKGVSNDIQTNTRSRSGINNNKGRIMSKKTVGIPGVKDPVKLSPGFNKKGLADYKLDIMGLCGFGCIYCSSNWGNYLRVNRDKFAEITEKQLGEKSYPSDDPKLTFVYPDVIEKLDAQLEKIDKSFGKNQVLVFSQLTDGFSPINVGSGLTRYVLDRILAKTSFKIRVMTKNAVVGSEKWVKYFHRNKDRFTVGLSIGSTDDDWSKGIEIGTSSQTARIEAINNLLDAGVETYVMLCPVFPHALKDNILENLLDQIRVNELEHVWSEPYNDRVNWKTVRDGLKEDHYDKKWFDDCFDKKNNNMWSDYASELYETILDKAVAEGWDDKFTYLLYEGQIESKDVKRFKNLHGILLQSPTDGDGYSKHSDFRNIEIDNESKEYSNAG